MIQGGNDEQIPVRLDAAAREAPVRASARTSSGGSIPGQSHAGVIAPSAADMIHWISDRFAGGANPDPYQPTGQADIQTTTCPS